MTCPCLICADGPFGDDAGLAETIRDDGWSALRVRGLSGFTYTVGLWHTFRRPELVMIGLDGEDMRLWLNTCAQLGKDEGWPAVDEPFRGVLPGHHLLLREMHSDWYDPLFTGTTLNRFYRGVRVPVLQLVWPDSDGRWPWDEHADSWLASQAQTWLPVASHPRGAWRLVGEFEPDFPFRASPVSQALTTQAVVAGRQPATVLFVEGVYDVLDERGYDADDLCLAHFGELVQRHPTLLACADGEAFAWDGSTWVPSTPSPPDLARSQQAWVGFQARAWLRSHDAEKIEHPGGTLYEHLVRTQERLRTLGLASHVQLAGLVFAAYGLDGSDVKLVGDRIDLRDLVGEQAETLAYRYAATDRRATWNQLAETGVLTNRFTGATEQLSGAALRDLVDLTIVRQLDVYEHTGQHADYFRRLFAGWAPLASPSVTAEAQRVLG